MGDYRNPGVGTFLYSAHEFAETLTNTHPFSLFSDFFKIYAVETPSTQQGIRVGSDENPISAPYPGTYLGTYLPRPWQVFSTRYAHALNIANWVSSDAIMTQIIANTRVGAGVAYVFGGSSYYSQNSLGISTRILAWPNLLTEWTVYHKTVYHNIVIHELGHTFGQLVDEHGGIHFSPPLLSRANVASATDTDEELKWGHWLGHAGITRRAAPDNAPIGANFPSPNNSCIMQGWQDAFCAVCSAELTRRMAMISGETFEVGRRPNGTVRPTRDSVIVAS